MNTNLFSPIHAILGDISRCAEALSAKVDDTWNEEQRKLLEIIRISAYNPARWLTAVPSESHDVTVWKHDALSPIIAITGAAELLVEDFDLSAEDTLRDYAQRILDASVKARQLVIEIADAALRRMPNG
jgi:hypothetical protein